MKILLINGSPLGEKSNTKVLTDAFLEGASEFGALSETVYLKDKNINPCRGCMSCWLKTPGKCVYNDDMPELIKKIIQSDVIVFGSPLYFFNFTGIMKDFVDRLMPMMQPFIDMKNGVSSHPLRYKDFNPRAFVLISNSGFPEINYFRALKDTFCMIAGNIAPNKANIICCAGGAILHDPKTRKEMKWYLDAVKQASREIAKHGSICDETKKILDTPLVQDTELYAKRANEQWQKMGLKRL